MRGEKLSPPPDLPTPSTIFSIRNSAEIPATELPRIFEKFYRVPSADPWKEGGTGLGLALVQKLVQKLEGSIQVESSHGWTTFTVELTAPVAIAEHHT
jgi:signal transduction histidine kinase